MAGVILDGRSLPVTGDLDEFREWMGVLGEGAPHASFLAGEVWLEMSPQNFRTHQPVVEQINRVLGRLAEDFDLGRYFSPPSWVTAAEVGLSTEPDGFAARWTTLQAGRLAINAARDHELLGVPDFALEAVSTTSATKDLVLLRELYARAGVAEYWIADAREDATLTVLSLVSGAYQQVPAVDGWLASPFWGRSFRLEAVVDRAGWPDFRLHVRP